MIFFKKNHALKKHTQIFSGVSCVLATLAAVEIQAKSLDEAVAEQLGTPIGTPSGFVGCGNLHDAGSNLVGALQTYCARFAPEGATTAASGGGSATTTAVPRAEAHSADSQDDAISKNNGNWSWFLTGETETLEKSESETEGAFDSDVQRVVMGISYAPTTQASFSLAVDRNEQDGDFENGGTFAHQSTGIRLLGTFNPTDNFSLMISGAYDDITSERTRISSVNDSFNGGEINFLSGTPTSDYSYNQLGVNLRGSYQLTSGKFSFTPMLGIDWLDTDYGTFSESGNSGLELRFHDDAKTSMQSVLGFQGSYAISTDFGAFIPQFSAIWRHEFEADSRDVNVSFVQDLNATQFSYQTDELDSDFVDASIGGVFVFAQGVQAYANVQTLLAHKYFDSFIASIGLRIEF